MEKSKALRNKTEKTQIIKRPKIIIYDYSSFFFFGLFEISTQID